LQIANHKSMKPQDILIALKILSLSGQKMAQFELAKALGISPTEVSFALKRLSNAGLLSKDKGQINKLALKEFLVHGLKYVFPAKIGTKGRGFVTAHSASPIKEQIVQNEEVFVWSYSYGTTRGYVVEPLYKTVPQIVSDQPELYELLAIVDTLRIGRPREVEIAISELEKRLN